MCWAAAQGFAGKVCYGCLGSGFRVQGVGFRLGVSGLGLKFLRFAGLKVGFLA